MTQQTSQETDTSEMLSMEEINARFDGEWVLLIDPLIEKGPKLLGGKVAFHSKDKRAVHRKGAELRPTSSAFLYIGKPDKDMMYLL